MISLRLPRTVLLAAGLLTLACNRGPTEVYDPSTASYEPVANLAPGFSIIDTVTIHVAEHSAFPSAVALPNGEVLVFYRNGAEHNYPNGRILLSRLVRKGGKWHVVWTNEVLDSDQDERFAGAARLPDGTLVLNIFSSDPASPRSSRLSVFRSHDEALTWPDQISYTASGVPGNQSSSPQFGTNSAVLELPNGDLLMPIYGTEQGTSLESSYLLRSSNRGLAWFFDHTVATDTSRFVGYSEPALALTGRGVEIAYRASAVGPRALTEDGFVFTNSTDLTGRNTTPPTALPFWGYPANLLRTKSGLLIMTYGYRREPYGIAVRLSHDDGVTWETPGDGRLETGAQGVDTGYPSTVELPDGTLFTAYNLYRYDTGVYVKGVHWRAE
jgi:sialidase-1